MLLTSPQPGDVVRARDALWRVTQVHMNDSTSASTSPVHTVSLRGADDGNRWQECILLSPFDRLTTPTQSTRPRHVSRRRWMRAFRSVLANAEFAIAGGLGRYLRHGLAALAEARVSLMPHQIEPVLAVLDGVASRVLIADGVGLGKTIQAALMLRVLTARGQARRVLIVVPAGLRDQWQQELRTRMALASEVIDAASLAARVRVLPPDINPWRQPGIFITSLDFIKQPLVLHGVAGVVWDVLIVDEAHALTAGTDRAAAAIALARQSRLVLLLTATPHDGNEAAFASLCRVGAIEQCHARGHGHGHGHGPDYDNDSDHGHDPIAVFRRTRRSLGLPAPRRVRMLRVEPSASERHLHDLLARYTSRVEREHADPGAAAILAMTVLRKRASSSTWSLLRSIERRSALLSMSAPGSPRNPEVSQQRALPFDGDVGADVDVDADANADAVVDADEEPAEVLAAPGLANPHTERAWLSLLTQAARRALTHESKLQALLRLLRRVTARGEPAIVYTEYRDTLTHVLASLPPACAEAVAMLHGAMPRIARAEALQRFASGDATLLLATDAAGEGLNLQQRCRLVIDIELPWNPNRLEQRLGRVDRFGQTRTVHAIHLVLADTAEDALRQTLANRATRIEDALTDPRNDPETVWPQLHDEAMDAVQALERLRTLRVGASTAIEPRTPWIARVRRRWRAPFADLGPGLSFDCGFAHGLLCIWRTRIRISDAMSCTAREVITPLHVSGAMPEPTPELLTHMRARLDVIAQSTIDTWHAAERPWRDRTATRDIAIHDLLRSQHQPDADPQPLLFADIAAARDAFRIDRWRAPPTPAPSPPPPSPAPPTLAPPSSSTWSATFEHSLVLVLVIR